MKKIFILLILALLMVSCSHTEPLRITDVRYVPVDMDLTGILAKLEEARPNDVPSFPSEIDTENATDVEVYNYLANVISAYKSSLEAWKNFSSIQYDVLLNLNEEMQ